MRLARLKQTRTPGHCTLQSLSSSLFLCVLLVCGNCRVRLDMLPPLLCALFKVGGEPTNRFSCDVSTYNTCRKYRTTVSSKHTRAAEYASEPIEWLLAMRLRAHSMDGGCLCFSSYLSCCGVWCLPRTDIHALLLLLLPVLCLCCCASSEAGSERAVLDGPGALRGRAA